MIMLFSFSSSLIWRITLIDFQMLKLILRYWDKPSSLGMCSLEVSC